MKGSGLSAVINHAQAASNVAIPMSARVLAAQIRTKSRCPKAPKVRMRQTSTHWVDNLGDYGARLCDKVPPASGRGARTCERLRHGDGKGRAQARLPGAPRRKRDLLFERQVQ